MLSLFGHACRLANLKSINVAQRYANDAMRNGLAVFAYQLTDVEEGDGGFCCIPSSHKVPS